MNRWWMWSLLVIASAAVPARAQYPRSCPPSPPVVVLGAPVPDVTPFQGGRYSFQQPGVFSNSYYQPSYTAPRTYYPVDTRRESSRCRCQG